MAIAKASISIFLAIPIPAAADVQMQKAEVFRALSVSSSPKLREMKVFLPEDIAELHADMEQVNDALRDCLKS